MFKLLVVDDEPDLLHSIKEWLQSETLAVEVALTGEQGLALARQFRPDAVILDLPLGDAPGMGIIDRLREFDDRMPVILITDHAATEAALEAMKRGAFEHLLKPVDSQQLQDVVQRALELSRCRHVSAVFGDEAQAEDDERIIGRSPAMQAVFKAIGRLAPRDVTVLIRGESGTGKELVARAVWHHSARSAAPFLTLSCAAIPETLLESDLFGHERGAFPGAERRRIGKFEQAHRGTLFLDEIGDMSAAAQAKVLRLIQEQSFERLGGDETIQIDVRLIAATNKDLDEEVAAGRLRADLLYRLNVFTIDVPPLRERREDIPLLLEYFLPRLSRGLGQNLASVTPEALRCLLEYAWPGNVRQLQSVLKYAIVQGSGDVLTLECLPENLRSDVAPSPAGPPAPATWLAGLADFTEALLRAGELDIYRSVCLEMDRVVLRTVLHHVNGNQVKASELLGISRTTLRAKLRGLNLGGEKQLPADASDVNTN
jgi:DNA-binding NtrC family response regulator